MEAELNSEPDAASQNAAIKLVTGAEAGAEKAVSGVLGADAKQDLDGLTPDEKAKALLKIIRHELAEDKAEDVVTIDLGGKSEIADAMVIASGRSQRHVGAIADKILRRLKDAGAKGVKCEGQPACDWVLIDAGDVILHLFRPEVRSFYNLERIWSETAHAASGSAN